MKYLSARANLLSKDHFLLVCLSVPFLTLSYCYLNQLS